MRKNFVKVFSIAIVAVFSVVMLAACGESKKQVETWGDWQIVSVATCTNAGEEARTSNKGAVETRVIAIDADGHEWSGWLLTIAVGCENDGQIERICLLCDRYEKKIILATGHNHEISHIEAGCENGGYDEHVCNDCGDSYVENETSATGHEFGEWNVTVEPGCESNGEKEKTCQTCGEIVKKCIHATGHSYELSQVDATCTEGGYDEYVCEGCGDSYIDNETDALGHEFGDWETISRPTWDNDGMQQRVCARCCEVQTRIILSYQKQLINAVKGLIRR